MEAIMPKMSTRVDGRPAFQFYPDLWQTEPSLMLVGYAEKGLWMDLLCIMWNCTPRGALVINGKPITESKTIAKLSKGEANEVSELIANLEQAGVFSRLDDGTIICRKMYREWILSEKRAEAGAKGGQAKRKQKPSKTKAKGESKTEAKVPSPTPTPSPTPIPTPEESGDLTGKEPVKSLFEADGIERKLSYLLRRLILENNPSARITENQVNVKWPKVVDLMIRRDYRTPEEIGRIIEWCQADDFWHKNIGGMTKLRQQFDRLTLQMGPQQCGGNSAPPPAPVEEELFDEWGYRVRRLPDGGIERIYEEEA